MIFLQQLLKDKDCQIASVDRRRLERFVFGHTKKYSNRIYIQVD